MMTIKKREGKNQKSKLRNNQYCEGLQGAEDWRIYDRAGAVGDLRHPLPHLQLLDLGGDWEGGGQVVEQYAGLLLEIALGDGTRSSKSSTQS